MRKMIVAFGMFAILAGAGLASAESERVCFSLSPDGRNFSKTPELLCTEFRSDSKLVQFTFLTGMPPMRKVAEFDLEVLRTETIPDSNSAEPYKLYVFGVSNPVNSIFNRLSIMMKEKESGNTGVMKIGNAVFFYKEMGSESKSLKSLVK